jgi:hypothetical protein
LFYIKYPCRQRLHRLTLCIYYVRTPRRSFSILLNLFFSRQMNNIDYGAFRTLETLQNFAIFRASIRETCMIHRINAENKDRLVYAS